MQRSKTIVRNLTQVDRSKWTPDHIYIGRLRSVMELIGASVTDDPIWGNPFHIGPDGDRQQVIAKYEVWLPTQPQLMARLPELKGKILV